MLGSLLACPGTEVPSISHRGVLVILDHLLSTNSIEVDLLLVIQVILLEKDRFEVRVTLRQRLTSLVHVLFYCNVSELVKKDK